MNNSAEARPLHSSDQNSVHTSVAPAVISTALLTDMMDSMEQGIIVWDAEGICELHNARVFDVLELGQDDLCIGMSRADFLRMAVQRGEFASDVADQAMARFEKREPFSFDRTMPSGRIILTSARPRECGGFVVTLSDLTQIKANEAALGESRDRAEAAEAEVARQLHHLTLEKAALEEQQTLLSRLSMVATHAKDLIAIITERGDVEWVNEAFSQALGYTLSEIAGQALLDTLCGEDTCVGSLQNVREGLRARQLVKDELICYRKSEDALWMELEITPVFTELAEHTHFVAVGRDISERKSAERTAIQARDFEHRKHNETRLLAEFNGWLQTTDSLTELFPVVSAFMRQLLPTSSGAVYVYANSRDVLEGVCNWNDGKMLANFEPPDCWALRRGRDYYYGENDVDFPCHHVLDCQEGELPERHYCLPIIAHGDTVGLLCIEFQDRAGDDNREETQKLANFCGEQISLAIANVQLREQLLDQSTRDALTSLFNRRYFIECVRRDLNSRGDKGVASVISFDVDRFKKFNDNFGHDAGDCVLREMSKVLVSTFRGSDVPCRYGGEEFAIYLPGANAEIARRRAEELRLAVEDCVVRYSGEELKVTISSGIATYPDNGQNVQALIKSADLALYAAKDAGRNATRHCDDLTSN